MIYTEIFQRLRVKFYPIEVARYRETQLQLAKKTKFYNSALQPLKRWILLSKSWKLKGFLILKSW